MSKIKNVIFEFELEGVGVVNYDSNDQKFIWNRESKNGNKNNLVSIHNNVNYSKKHIYRNENGELDYKIKISSDCLRNSIFRNDAISTNPSISHHPFLLNSFIGSVQGLIRGYMFAGKNETLKRKSPLTITPAIQTNNSVSHLEIGVRSGEKIVNSDSDKGDTTLRNVETVGEMTYSGKGNINLQNLQFMSCDTVFDRYEFNSDNIDILNKVLENTLPNFDSELGYYKLKSSSVNISEYGLKLNNENVLFLVKEVLKRISDISIMRNTSYANISKLRIKLVNSPLIDTYENQNGWIDINNVSDIDSLDFDVEDFYVYVEEEEALTERKEIIENV